MALAALGHTLTGLVSSFVFCNSPGAFPVAVPKCHIAPYGCALETGTSLGLTASLLYLHMYTHVHLQMSRDLHRDPHKDGFSMSLARNCRCLCTFASESIPLPPPSPPTPQHEVGERLRTRRTQLANEQQEQEGIKGYVQQQRERLKMELDKLRREQDVVEAAARQHRTVAEKVRGGDSSIARAFGISCANVLGLRTALSRVLKPCQWVPGQHACTSSTRLAAAHEVPVRWQHEAAPSTTGGNDCSCADAYDASLCLLSCTLLWSFPCSSATGRRASALWRRCGRWWCGAARRSWRGSCAERTPRWWAWQRTSPGGRTCWTRPWRPTWSTG